MPSIPIDPFKLMREYGIVYQLMEFENLEGIYLVRKVKMISLLLVSIIRGKLPGRDLLPPMNYVIIYRIAEAKYVPKAAMEVRQSGSQNSLQRNCSCLENYSYLSHRSMQRMGKFPLMMRCRLQSASE